MASEGLVCTVENDYERLMTAMQMLRRVGAVACVKAKKKIMKMNMKKKTIPTGQGDRILGLYTHRS